MKKWIIFFPVLSAVGMMLVSCATTYEYTGNPFTLTAGPYTKSDFVTATVTLASPLPPNAQGSVVTPTAFTFSDGVQTITDHSGAGSLMTFSTGPTGAITAWHIGIQFERAPSNSIVTESVPGAVTDEVHVNSAGGGYGYNKNAPGTWTQRK
jgi:hypothetical protein